jgi:hypothetical protein
MSRICLVLFIQNLSRILSCPEYVQLNCPEFFHVQNMSGFIYPEFVQNSFMPRICPVFSAHKKFRTVNLTILPDIFQIFSEPHGQIPDIFDDIFWIFLFRREVVRKSILNPVKFLYDGDAIMHLTPTYIFRVLMLIKCFIEI